LHSFLGLQSDQDAHQDVKGNVHVSSRRREDVEEWRYGCSFTYS